MRVDTAVELVNDLVFRPGWTITAEDYSHRHEGTICVSFVYETRNFVREEAPDYKTVVTAPNTIRYQIVVGDMSTPEELYFALLKRIERINSHEDREALRDRRTKWAPFYPHKIDGQKRWAALNGSNVEDDLVFGVA
jgi:hypothetical protein